jgi:hypothetical protein
LMIGMRVPSVGVHGGVDLACPRVHTALQVVELTEAAAREEVGHAQAAHAVMADHHQFLLRVEFPEARRDLTHGDVARTGQGADVELPTLAHIEQDRLFTGLRQPFLERAHRHLLHDLEHEGTRRERILEWRQVGFEQAAGVEAGFGEARDTLRCHRRGLTNDGDQPAADLKLLFECLR